MQGGRPGGDAGMLIGSAKHVPSIARDLACHAATSFPQAPLALDHLAQRERSTLDRSLRPK